MIRAFAAGFRFLTKTGGVSGQHRINQLFNSQLRLEAVKRRPNLVASPGNREGRRGASSETGQVVYLAGFFISVQEKI